MNPFTTGAAAFKIFASVGQYNRHSREIDKLHEAGDFAAEKELIRDLQVKTISDINRKLGLTYTVVGRENIPSDDEQPVMIYANHQGYADIFAMFEAIQTMQIGFLAKDDFRSWPYISKVIKYTRSIFLVRGGGREAIKAIKEAQELTSKGFNLAIFPEGTRSRGPEMGEFKHGAFKFAQKCKVPILPISIDKSYELFEGPGTFQKAHIYIKIHPLVHIEQMNKSEQDEAFRQVEQTIRQGQLDLRALAEEEANANA